MTMQAGIENVLLLRFKDQIALFQPILSLSPPHPLPLITKEYSSALISSFLQLNRHLSQEHHRQTRS